MRAAKHDTAVDDDTEQFEELLSETLELRDSCHEYDCRDCGRHIYQFGGPVTGLCGACTTISGWYLHPDIARAIDPDHLRNPRENPA